MKSTLIKQGNWSNQKRQLKEKNDQCRRCSKEQLSRHKSCGQMPSIIQMKKILETKKARKDLNDVFQERHLLI